MVESEKNCIAACNQMMSFVGNEIRRNDVSLALTYDSTRINAEYLTEIILSMMVRGVYRTKTLPSDEFIAFLEQTLYSPSCEKIIKIKDYLRVLYAKDISRYAKANVAALVSRSLKKNTDIAGTIRGYFFGVSNEVVCEIEKMLKGGWLI